MQSNKNDRYEANGFTGSWLPRGIMTSLLADAEKLLLSQIYNLDNGQGCSATNGYLAASLAWHPKKIERTLGELRNGGFISVALGMKRFLYVTDKTRNLVDTPTNLRTPDKSVPPTEMRTPPDNFVGTPPTNLRDTPDKFEDHIIQDITVNNTGIEQSAEVEISEVEVLDVDLILTGSGSPKAEPKKNKGGRGAGKRALAIQDAQFENCWTSYERYGSKKKALAYWKQLTPLERDAIEATIPHYVASTPGCEYRKMFEGWINPENRLWERPIKRRISQAEQSAQKVKEVITHVASEEFKPSTPLNDEIALLKSFGLM